MGIEGHCTGKYRHRLYHRAPVRYTDRQLETDDRRKTTMPITLGELRLYTIEEICEKLNVSRRTLYNYIKGGRLKAQKFGCTTYVSEDALRDYFNPPKKTI